MEYEERFASALSAAAINIGNMLSNMDHVARFVLNLDNTHDNIVRPTGISFLSHNSLTAQYRELGFARSRYREQASKGDVNIIYFNNWVKNSMIGIQTITHQVLGLLYIYTVTGSLKPDHTLYVSDLSSYVLCKSVEVLEMIPTESRESLIHPTFYNRYSSHNAMLQKFIFGGLYSNCGHINMVLPCLSDLDLLRIRSWLDLKLDSLLKRILDSKDSVHDVHESLIDHWQNTMLSNYVFVRDFDQICLGRTFRLTLSLFIPLSPVLGVVVQNMLPSG